MEIRGKKKKGGERKNEIGANLAISREETSNFRSRSVSGKAKN